MATEKDLEWLDDYLSNKMEGNDKALFEERLKTDASLRSEMAIQKALIEGIRKTRAADLKFMLSQTPIPAAGISSGLGKSLAWVIVAAALGTGAYFYFTETDTPADVATTEPATEQPVESAPAEVPATEDDIQQETPAAEKEPSAITDDYTEENSAPEASQEATETRAERKAPVAQPKVTPFDPTKELESGNEKPEVDADLSGTLSSESSIQVVTDDSNKKYSFHYRFEGEKLFLLGSFEKDLYEIMEFFNNNKRTVFLYYNDNFYLLDEEQADPVALRAISDPQLLSRLREYRK